MAFDGVTVAAVVKEIADSCIGGRINKIAQPEPDELLLTIKTGGEQKNLLISAGASLPLIYFTQGSKQSPMTAPAFVCFSESICKMGVLYRFHSRDWSELYILILSTWTRWGICARNV